MLGVTPGCCISVLRGTQACGHCFRGSAGVAYGPRACSLSIIRIFVVYFFFYGYFYLMRFIFTII